MDNKNGPEMQPLKDALAEMKQSTTYHAPVPGAPILGIGGELGARFLRPEEMSIAGLFGLTDAEKQAMEAKGNRLSKNFNEIFAVDKSAKKLDAPKPT